MQTQYADVHPDTQAAIDGQSHSHSQSAPKSLWEQGYLAASLALIAGYVDAYAYLNYKIYVSFMSGNSTQTGLQIGQTHFAVAWHDFLPILAFVVGVFGATWLLHGRLSQPLRWLFVVCAALLGASLLGASLLGARPGAMPDWGNIVFLGAAMGALNATVTKVGQQSVGLGYVTGTLNNLAQHFALALKRLPVPGAQGAWDTHPRRIAVLGGVWCGFVVGALLGAVAVSQLVLWTLLPPILLLVALALFDHAKSESA